MKRTDALDAAPGGLFTDGDPLAPVEATVLDASWLNMVQEELANVIEAAGIVLDDGDDTQLLQALTFFMSGLVSFAVAQALTTAQQTQARENINAPSAMFCYFMGQS